MRKKREVKYDIKSIQELESDSKDRKGISRRALSKQLDYKHDALSRYLRRHFLRIIQYLPKD